jgi:hypothetical protein
MNDKVEGMLKETLFPFLRLSTIQKFFQHGLMKQEIPQFVSIHLNLPAEMYPGNLPNNNNNSLIMSATYFTAMFR